MDSEGRFYVLGDDPDGPRAAYFVTADEMETGDAPRCPQCDQFISSRRFLPPLRMEIQVGREGPGDLIMGAGGDPLVSERFVSAFRQEGLTGVTGFSPVEIVKVKPSPARMGVLPEYMLALVCFGRGAVDEAHSKLRRAVPLKCSECRSPGVDGIYGFRIEPGTWASEDVFRPRGLQSRLVVSERFAEWVRRHELTNIRLIPTEQFTFDPLRKGPPAAPANA